MDALNQAQAALETCQARRVQDVDGDWITLYQFDPAKVTQARVALAATGTLAQDAAQILPSVDLADVFQRAQDARDAWVGSFPEVPSLRSTRAFFVQAILSEYVKACGAPATTATIDRQQADAR